ncbi:hypothetical protein BaRGS_00007252 [Batillaria attramentaria]|uniref:Uncharacterized protein n=1 Tax=Batillaria attramentaria TaxID=370345 RepID=A0ABD0LQC9_9CAEN
MTNKRADCGCQETGALQQQPISPSFQIRVLSCYLTLDTVSSQGHVTGGHRTLNPSLLVRLNEWPCREREDLANSA